LQVATVIRVPEALADIVAILYPEVDSKNRATYLRGIPAEWKGLQKVQTLGGVQDMATVLEPGLYSLNVSGKCFNRSQPIFELAHILHQNISTRF
jgi:hypothetical protein